MGVEKGSVLNAFLKAVFQPFELKGIIRFRRDDIREVPVEEYPGFASRSKSTVVEDQAIQLDLIEVKRLEPLQGELTDVSTAVRSFPERGYWAPHRGDYRGNWAHKYQCTNP